MTEHDTIELLRQCDAGLQMGISSLDEVLDCVGADKLKRCLVKSKSDHEQLRDQLQELLDQYHEEGKEPTPMAKTMSWVKTNVKLALNESDATIADLITDGCNMGVKSLRKYMNQYEAADKKARAIAEKLIDLEVNLVEDIRPYL